MIYYDTVKELVFYLLTLDQDLPLACTYSQSPNMLGLGISVTLDPVVSSGFPCRGYLTRGIYEKIHNMESDDEDKMCVVLDANPGYQCS